MCHALQRSPIFFYVDRKALGSEERFNEVTHHLETLNERLSVMGVAAGVVRWSDKPNDVKMMLPASSSETTTTVKSTKARKSKDPCRQPQPSDADVNV